jgi:membrane protease YdiL (CAAX protease family)
MLFENAAWAPQLTSIGKPIVFAIGFPIHFVIVLAVQFVLNAVPEEFLFRGFLWGFMRQAGLSDFSILCIQAILFWVGHYWYWDMPIAWIRVLFGGLLYGAVAWRTKSLFLSAIVHAGWNCSSVFVHIP